VLAYNHCFPRPLEHESTSRYTHRFSPAALRRAPSHAELRAFDASPRSLFSRERERERESRSPEWPFEANGTLGFCRRSSLAAVPRRVNFRARITGAGSALALARSAAVLQRSSSSARALDLRTYVPNDRSGEPLEPLKLLLPHTQPDSARCIWNPPLRCWIHSRRHAAIRSHFYQSNNIKRAYRDAKWQAFC